MKAEQASSHPIPDAHSIWELILHIGRDYALVLRRLTGDGRRLLSEEDWPSCPPATAENWQEAEEELRLLNKQLRDAVRAFPAERLDEPLVSDISNTAYDQCIGVTLHNLNHAGQISLLKRALISS